MTAIDFAKSVEELTVLLANTYLLYLKTQNCHWNIEDSRFHMLHLFLEEQYEELAEAVDDIAERIRMLGHTAPASFAEFLRLATLSEGIQLSNGQIMLQKLYEDHQHIIVSLRQGLFRLDSSADEGTKDFLIERLRTHEKQAWMIKSHFKN